MADSPDRTNAADSWWRIDFLPGPGRDGILGQFLGVSGRVMVLFPFSLLSSPLSSPLSFLLQQFACVSELSLSLG